MVGVCIDPCHIFSRDVHCLHLTSVNGIQHLNVIKTWFTWNLNPIGRFEIGTNRIVCYQLVSGEDVWHCSHISSTLYVIMSTKRIRSSTRTHKVPCDKQKIGYRSGCMRTCHVLC